MYDVSGRQEPCEWGGGVSGRDWIRREAAFRKEKEQMESVNELFHPLFPMSFRPSKSRGAFFPEIECKK